MLLCQCGPKTPAISWKTEKWKEIEPAWYQKCLCVHNKMSPDVFYIIVNKLKSMIQTSVGLSLLITLCNDMLQQLHLYWVYHWIKLQDPPTPPVKDQQDTFRLALTHREFKDLI